MVDNSHKCSGAQSVWQQSGYWGLQLAPMVIVKRILWGVKAAEAKRLVCGYSLRV